MKPIIETIQKQLTMSFEEGVVKAVQEVGIVVDKKRLEKALYDAKSFYEEGFNDGLLHGSTAVDAPGVVQEDCVARESVLEIVKRTSGDYATAFSMIRQLPATDVVPVVHGEWIPTTKHKWITDNQGKVDTYAWSREYHNGPVCEICGFNPCEHCRPDYDEDEDCAEHFVCSVCGRHEDVKHPYCHCGAKMDGGKR